MIRYSLKCSADHAFDSWFQSGDAYDTLTAGGRVTCPICGSVRIDKALMAPALGAARGTAVAETPARPLAAPASEIEATLLALRRQIEESSEYVGPDFAAEARRIHDGDAPTRWIYGETRPDEARKLIEDGVPVAPLPFVPLRRTN